MAAGMTKGMTNLPTGKLTEWVGAGPDDPAVGVQHLIPSRARYFDLVLS
jgi:hypothetical protein